MSTKYSPSFNKLHISITQYGEIINHVMSHSRMYLESMVAIPWNIWCYPEFESDFVSMFRLLSRTKLRSTVHAGKEGLRAQPLSCYDGFSLKGHGLSIYGHIHNLYKLHQLHKIVFFISMCLELIIYIYIDDQNITYVFASKGTQATYLNSNLQWQECV